MKTRYLMLVLIVSSTIAIRCSKDDNPSGSGMTSQKIAQSQNFDVQDAIADKIDQDADNAIDELQAQNYMVAAARSYTTDGSITVTVDHPDSTFFPKIVTITYSNYQDGTATESFIKNGVMVITITATTNKQLVTREFVYKNLSVTTDSTTFAVKGTRKVARTAQALKYNGLQALRISATDQITSSLSYTLVKTGATDSLKFTRSATKLRTSILHYDNIGGLTWKTVKFRNNLSKDTLAYSGTVTGINEKGDTYTKFVSISTPITVIYYERTPVLISGTQELTIAGAVNVSLTITYKEDPTFPKMTLVTVANNKTGATHSFNRRFSRKPVRWW